MPLANALNPFTSTRIQPGAFPFLFLEEASDSPKQLVEKLATFRWRGEIVGPHGSGKSTLIASLIPLCEQQGKLVVHLRLSDGQRSLPWGALTAPWSSQTLVVIAGYEQLSWLSRLRLQWRLRSSGAGLLITTHKPTGQPTLLTIRPTWEVAQKVSARLQEGYIHPLSAEEIRDSYNRHHPNVREMLFDLYDRYQAKILQSRTNDPNQAERST